jgi:hypothetical protein
MARKREDPATVGDLDDAFGVVKKSFADLAESVKGQVLKAPDPKDDKTDDKTDDGKTDDKTDDNGDKSDFVPSWGSVSSWFGKSS